MTKTESRLITLASQRVVQGKKTPKAAAEYSKLVKQLAARTDRDPRVVRLWARRQAYRAAA